MEDRIRQFLTMVCEQLRQTPGSIEIVRTYGTSVLEDTSHHWIEFAASNLMEIHTDVESMIDMIRGFGAYDDKLSQFMHDFTGIMDDFAFHAAVFNVYFFSIEGVTKREVQESSRGSWNKSAPAPGIEGYRDNISAIADVWDLKIDAEQKRSLLMDITLESLCVTDCFERLFGDTNKEREVDQYWHLRRLYRAIAALQFYWSVIRCT